MFDLGIPSSALFAIGAILGVVPLSYWLWGQLMGAKAMEHQLRTCGFEPDGDGFVRRRGGIALRARLSRQNLTYLVTLQGPELPPGTPRFQPGNPNARVDRSAQVVLSGDVGFDAKVRTLHPDDHVGLSWLQADVRSAVREALPLPSRIMEGRWCYRQVCTPLTDVERIAECITRVSTAMAEAPPSVDARLEALACEDEVPRVRARAVDALSARDALGPELLSTLVACPYAEVHLALVRAGGPKTADAWRALRRSGARRQRTQGAT